MNKKLVLQILENMANRKCPWPKEVALTMPCKLVRTESCIDCFALKAREALALLEGREPSGQPWKKTCGACSYYNQCARTRGFNRTTPACRYFSKIEKEA